MCNRCAPFGQDTRLTVVLPAPFWSSSWGRDHLLSLTQTCSWRSVAAASSPEILKTHTDVELHLLATLRHHSTRPSSCLCFTNHVDYCGGTQERRSAAFLPPHSSDWRGSLSSPLPLLLLLLRLPPRLLLLPRLLPRILLRLLLRLRLLLHPRLLLLPPLRLRLPLPLDSAQV